MTEQFKPEDLIEAAREKMRRAKETFEAAQETAAEKKVLYAVSHAAQDNSNSLREGAFDLMYQLLYEPSGTVEENLEKLSKARDILAESVWAENSVEAAHRDIVELETRQKDLEGLAANFRGEAYGIIDRLLNLEEIFAEDDKKEQGDE